VKITFLSQDMIPAVIALLEQGAPYVRPRTPSDYWMYATLFSTTCPIAFLGDQPAGTVMAFRSQDNPEDLYVQDVMTHPLHRRAGIATALLDVVTTQGRAWGCRRLYLTSEPENSAAHHTWSTLGFTNLPGDQEEIHGVHVISNYKGPGKHRAVYELRLT
jgi:GNAT superfamily N-acetyltransferase